MPTSTSGRQTETARRRAPAAALPLLLGAATLGGPLCGAAATAHEPAAHELRVTGRLYEPDDLSAVAVVGGYLVVGSDEGERLQVLEPLGDGTGYRVLDPPIRLLGAEQEVDVEALAWDGEWLYALGSHSLKRRLLEADKTRAENLARLAAVSPEPFRHRLFRIALDPRSGKATAAPEWTSLRDVLERDAILGPFTRIPDKENGLSLEGLAARGGRLFVGCRSPVLREGLVPVIVLGFDEPSRYELRFLRLGGRGIRALARVGDGFLVLACFERGDEAVLYHWDGGDQLPGRDRAGGRSRRLLELHAEPGSMPEGIAVMREEERFWEVVVVHDGLRGGRITRLRVARPASGTDHSSR